MPRPTRHLPQGWSFHITLRCNSREFLITKGLKRDVLLRVLLRAQEKVLHRLYGVCLMANQLHLLIRPDDATQLPRLMHWIGWCSAMALNCLSGRCGHFWEARYDATGWFVMVSANGTHPSCNWHPRSTDAPDSMSVSARSIAITPAEHPSATGAQGC